MKPKDKKIPDCSLYVPSFASYYQRNISWGIFHVAFDDCNWTLGCASPKTQEEDRLASIFNKLTPSQRRKLATKAEEWARDAASSPVRVDFG